MAFGQRNVIKKDPIICILFKIKTKKIKGFPAKSLDLKKVVNF